MPYDPNDVVKAMKHERIDPPGPGKWVNPLQDQSELDSVMSLLADQPEDACFFVWLKGPYSGLWHPYVWPMKLGRYD